LIVQIYEIQTPFEAERCIEAGVNHIGSVLLSKKDWRQPMIRETVRVSDGTPVKNSIIPLFHDTDILFRLLDYYRPHFIHFCESVTDDHGREIDLEGPIQMQRKIKESFPDIGIIRSIPIPRDNPPWEFPTPKISQSFEPVSDLFLTDTWLGKEPIDGFIGITGKPCNTEIAGELVDRSRIPVILAGGLSPENVYDAVMDVHPAGADSCTWTNAVDKEGKPIRFQKDFIKVKRFVDEVERAERDLLNKKERLQKEIAKLKELLRDREAALPAHSIRPHQIQAIEALEDEIDQKEAELLRLKKMDADAFHSP
jgi:phosphoribosylanthranilate isomerase